MKSIFVVMMLLGVTQLNGFKLTDQKEAKEFDDMDEEVYIWIESEAVQLNDKDDDKAKKEEKKK